MLGESIAGRLRGHVDDVGPSWVMSLPAPAAALPQVHRDLLREFNGFVVGGGTLRMFGIARDDSLSLETWNDRSLWRSSWDERIDGFVCFGSTAWGDLYAYRRGVDGEVGREVYFLEATLLRPEVLAGSFEEFAERELLRVALRGAYDSLTIAALNRFGPIAASDLWVYAPSLALGGDESMDHVVLLPAQDAMGMAGDIATALRESVPGSWPTRVEPWVDERGRRRLKVLFDRA